MSEVGVCLTRMGSGFERLPNYASDLSQIFKETLDFLLESMVEIVFLLKNLLWRDFFLKNDIVLIKRDCLITFYQTPKIFGSLENCCGFWKAIGEQKIYDLGLRQAYFGSQVENPPTNFNEQFKMEGLNSKFINTIHQCKPFEGAYEKASSFKLPLWQYYKISFWILESRLSGGFAFCTDDIIDISLTDSVV